LACGLLAAGLLSGCLAGADSSTKPVLRVLPLQSRYVPGDTLFFEGELHVKNTFLHHFEVHVQPDSYTGLKVIVLPADTLPPEPGTDLDLRRNVGAGLVVADDACGKELRVKLVTHMMDIDDPNKQYYLSGREAVTVIEAPSCTDAQ
jgi:hypothetical protein